MRAITIVPIIVEKMEKKARSLSGRDHVVDGAQELQPLLMAMPVLAHGDDLAFERIERDKKHDC